MCKGIKEEESMTVSCIPDEIKDDLVWWMQDRISTLENIKKLHRALLKEEEVKWDFDPIKETQIRRIRKKPMSKEGYEAFHGLCDDAIMNYTNLGLELMKCPSCGAEEFEPLFGTIKCMPREIKTDIAPYLKRRAKQYAEEGKESISTEANKLADLFMNKVANCTGVGTPSYPWLHRRGHKKSDLVEEGNILQIP